MRQTLFFILIRYRACFFFVVVFFFCLFFFVGGAGVGGPILYLETEWWNSCDPGWLKVGVIFTSRAPCWLIREQTCSCSVYTEMSLTRVRTDRSRFTNFRSSRLNSSSTVCNQKTHRSRTAVSHNVPTCSGHSEINKGAYQRRSRALEQAGMVSFNIFHQV